MSPPPFTANRLMDGLQGRWAEVRAAEVRATEVRAAEVREAETRGQSGRGQGQSGRGEGHCALQLAWLRPKARPRPFGPLGPFGPFRTTVRLARGAQVSSYGPCASRADLTVSARKDQKDLRDTRDLAWSSLRDAPDRRRPPQQEDGGQKNALSFPCPVIPLPANPVFLIPAPADLCGSAPLTSCFSDLCCSDFRRSALLT